MKVILNVRVDPNRGDGYGKTGKMTVAAIHNSSKASFSIGDLAAKELSSETVKLPYQAEGLMVKVEFDIPDQYQEGYSFVAVSV